MFTGDVVVKVGGPVYRIGVGGGAASSIQVYSRVSLAWLSNKMGSLYHLCVHIPSIGGV